MRPYIILGLVLAVITALVVTLVGGPGDPSPGEVAGRDAAAPSRAQAPKRPVEAQPQPSAKAAPIARAEPLAPDVRTSVARTVDEDGQPIVTSWDNELRGVVTGPKGNPIAGVRVTLSKQVVSGQIAALQEMLAPAEAQQKGAKRGATTDEAGAFSVTSLPPGNNYTVVAEHDEFQRLALPNVVVPELGANSIELRMKRGWVLAGYVFDEEGQPIPDAKLELMSGMLAHLPSPDGIERKPPGTMEVLSASDGYYQFVNVATGTRMLRVSADGFGRRSIPNLQFTNGPANAPMQRDVELTRARSIAGRVVAPDRSGIEGATVEALFYGKGQNSRERTKTGPGGKFEIANLFDAPYLVVANADGFNESSHGQIEAGTADLVIEMAEQGSISGTIADAATGAGLSEFQCSLRKVDAKQGFYGHVLKKESFHEAEQGRFELDGVPDGKYILLVTAEGYADTYSESFLVTQGLVTADVTVKMGQGGTLVGTLLDKRSGAPVQGAKVTTFDNNFVENPLTDMLGAMVPRRTTQRSATSDADGRFRLELLTPELYQVQIQHPGYARVTLKDIQLREGAETELKTIRMSTGAQIAGTVFDAEGNALSGATVELRGAGSVDQLGRVYTDVSDAQGRFLITRVSGGTYTLSATSSASRMSDPFRTIIEMQNSEQRLTVIDGKEYTHELHLGG